MVEGHDRLKAILAAIRQHINVVIQRFIIERRRRPDPIDISWLDPAPLDPKTECVET